MVPWFSRQVFAQGHILAPPGPLLSCIHSDTENDLANHMSGWTNTCSETYVVCVHNTLKTYNTCNVRLSNVFSGAFVAIQFIHAKICVTDTMVRILCTNTQNTHTYSPAVGTVNTSSRRSPKLVSPKLPSRVPKSLTSCKMAPNEGPRRAPILTK